MHDVRGKGKATGRHQVEEGDPFEILAGVDAVLDEVLTQMDEHLSASEEALDQADELAAH
jgi:hypothetical protein